jgi:hypothetical protein
LTWEFERTAARPARIVSRRLSESGEDLVGESTVLVVPTFSWEGGVVEGPSIVRWNGVYLLFYSGSDWSSDHYATGLAICASERGPCVKSQRPVLASRPSQVSPGGLSAFVSGRHLLVAFHVWRHGVGYPRGARCLVISQLGFEAGTPRLVALRTSAGT